jgi:hypothetical protein
VCQITSSKEKQKYYYQQYRKRWLSNQDGYEIEKTLNKALMIGKLGTYSGCCLHTTCDLKQEK